MALPRWHQSTVVVGVTVLTLNPVFVSIEDGKVGKVVASADYYFLPCRAEWVYLKASAQEIIMHEKATASQ